MTSQPARWARAVWAAAEPFTLAGLVSPAGREALAVHGLPASSAYILFRSAPMGAVNPSVVTAAFRSLPGKGIARVLPAAWQQITPAEVVDLTHSSLARAWSGLAGDDSTSAARAVLPSLAEAVAAAPTGGRPLGAANAAVVLPDDPWAAAWRLLTALREGRGDGHVAALVAADLTVPESEVLMSAWAGPRIDEALLRKTRNIDDQTWTAAVHSLQNRALMAHDGTALTPAGRALRDAIEDTTDTAAASPWENLDERACQGIFDFAASASAKAINAGLIRAVTPVGAPWPSGAPTSPT